MTSAELAEHPTEISLALLSIRDDLDNEIVLAGGLLSAIGGLECNNGWEYDGTQALALLHIRRLREISADLTELKNKMFPPLPPVAPAATVECPELSRLYGEMLAISAEWNAIPLPYSTDEQADRYDEQADRYSERLAALEERIIATPAETLADVVLKLRVFRRYERDMPAPPRQHAGSPRSP